MRIRKTFHVSVLFMALLIFSMPLLTLAQQVSVEAEAVATAEADAEATTNKNFWFVVGCFGSLLGLIYANYDVPSPPASRLLGKSPEYVAFYSDTYTQKAQKLQTGYALRGCITQGLIGVVGYTGCLVVSIVGTATTAAVDD